MLYAGKNAHTFKWLLVVQ